MSKLTAKKVENALPRKKEYKLHDGGGLFLRVRPSGAKSWLFSFSLPNDRKLIRMTLGSVKYISLREARAMLPGLHKLVTSGIDPRHARIEARARNAYIVDKQESFNIWYESNPMQQDIQVLGDGIQTYAALKKNQPKMEFWAFLVRDKKNKILGGCNGSIYYGCHYIDTLWLDEKLRGKHIGTKLMHTAERFARDKNCLFSTVNTMDWEALDFYKKLGYEVEFERQGYLNNSTFYFLRKNLGIDF